MFIEPITKSRPVSRIQGEEIDSRILEKICVTPPYFSLRNIRLNDGVLHADFNAEQNDHEELLPITMAEVGRHLAILGSLQFALNNNSDSKFYYLANSAEINRVTNRVVQSTELKALVMLKDLNRKSGTITGIVCDAEMNELYIAEISYLVLADSIFERMFAHQKRVTPHFESYNPYRESVQFQNCVLDVESCTASIGVLTEKQCIGHFDNYPAMPIARLGNAMGKLAGYHFMHLNPQKKGRYFIPWAKINANQLVFAGEEIFLKTEILNSNLNGGMEIKTIAFKANNEIVADSVSHYF